MRRVLIVKTSSMGDVIHTLPAVSDALAHQTDTVFDWVVEEDFAEVPAWHPAVARVIPVAIRRWRKNPRKLLSSGEWGRFRQLLGAASYDCVIDAQGLIKSALLTRLVHAPRCGYDWRSAREPLATLAYTQRFSVEKEQHAVERTRTLFAQVLHYEKPLAAPDYGIDRRIFIDENLEASERHVPYLLFLHGTTRANKHWPDDYWRMLCRLLCDASYRVLLPWWSDAEHRRAKQIASIHARAEVLPRAPLAGMAAVIASARAVVAVDTGLGHLCAALAVPTLSLYGSTSPKLVGAYGINQYHLNAQDFSAASEKAASFEPLTPAIVFSRVQDMLANTHQQNNLTEPV